jgi:hypothetical protein
VSQKLLFASIAIAGLFSVAAPLQTPDSNALDVPIGAILIWWGRATDVPHGFEVCDGTVVSTKGAVLRGAKPNLQERFVRGTRDHRSFVPEAFAHGGDDALSLGGTTADHVLTLAELPAHAHPVASHSHTLPDHAHAIAPHTHGMDHIHQEQDHTHADGVGAAANVEPDTGGPPSASALTPDANGATQGASPTPLRTGGPIHRTTFASVTDTQANTAALSTANDGGGGSTSTLPAGNTGASGGGAGHSHALGSVRLDNRPAYLEVIFIIRVK